MNSVGYGYDVHRLVKGRKLVLGGVEIPCDRGLEGHSDGDVLVHALIDALLGGSSLGDIGELFPDDDPQYKDISSILLLKKVKKLIDKKNFGVYNIDIVLVAEKPRISSYKVLMKEALAKVLKIDAERINIKATTTEGLGFSGRGEGMAAHAIATLFQLNGDSVKIR